MLSCSDDAGADVGDDDEDIDLVEVLRSMRTCFEEGAESEEIMVVIRCGHS